MNAVEMHSITLCGVLGILTACTVNGSAQSTATSTAPAATQSASQMRASDRMFYWREEGRELHAMARHRERETELLLRTKPGPATTEFVKQMRLFAHQLEEAADYADTQAKKAAREIPSDMTQQLHSTP
ncbi:MAG: hypothetical protein P0120_15945 [Nitrospira sp.]|nr:hypothetical protein [Nitrospira sp.]